MLLIRTEQMETFRMAAIRNYEDDVIAHLKEFAPRLCEIRGDATVREVVQLGIRRAGNHLFTTRGPVRLYIDLMFTLGVDFDTDPQTPWAAAVLEDKSVGDESVRANRLFQWYQEYRAAVAGEQNEFLLDALRRIRSIERRRADSPYEPAIILSELGRVYPQKCEYVGEKALTQLVALGRRSAASFSISTFDGIALLTGLMFAFGHGVVTDPLYPWVGATLNDKLIEGPEAKVDRLYGKTMMYADRLLKNLAG
jgi:hypothetical protein